MRTTAAISSVIFYFIVFSVFGQVKPELVLPLGHTDLINHAEFSPDGKKVITASDDKTAKVWDVYTGRLLYEIKGHSGSVNYAVFSPDSKKIVTASDDYTAKIWDAASGSLLYTLEGHKDEMYAVAFSADGKKIATTSADYVVKLWNAENGTWLKDIYDQSNDHDLYSSILFSPDNRKLVSFYAKYGSATVWDVNTGTQLALIKGHTSRINTIHFSFDSKKIATASEDKTARIWNADSGNELVVLKGHQDMVWSAEFSPDGQKIITASEDGTSIIWDAINGRKILSLVTTDDYGTISARFSPDGKKCITAGQYGSAKIWDAQTGKLLISLDGQSGQVFSALFSPDGNKALTTTTDNTAEIWDATTGSLLAELKGRTSTIASAVFCENDKKILMISDDKLVRIWEPSSGKPAINLDWPAKNGNIKAFSTDHKKLIAYAYPGAFIWDVQTGTKITKLNGFNEDMDLAAYSPDDQKIFTCSNRHQTAKLWDAGTGALLTGLKGSTGKILAAAFSPDVRKIVTTAEDESIKIWDVNTGDLITNIKWSSGQYTWDDRFWSFQFDPEGNKIAIVKAYDDTVKIWNTTSGALNTMLIGHKGNVKSAVFNPAGDKMVTAAEDSLAMVWDVKTGKRMAVLKGHQDWVVSAVFSQDAKTIVTSSLDNTVKIWDAITYELIRSVFLGLNTYLFDISFEENRLIGRRNSELILFDMQTGNRLYSYISVGEKECIILLPSGEYMTTKEAAQYLAWRSRAQYFDFEQWDIQYNRPDKVLTALGNINFPLISAYREAYFKRIRKLGVDTVMFGKDYSAPDIQIVNEEDIYGKTDKSFLTLTLQATDPDPAAWLHKLFILVNGNPVYGIQGLDVEYKRSREIILEIPVSLSEGMNTIKVSCLNNHAAESLKQTAYIAYEPKTPAVSKTWFIGIGVSRYKDSIYDLTYAEKDITDLSKTFAGADITMLLNESATKENILSLKNKLLKTNIEDEVIISVSGHGLLSDSLDFYFATYDTDFKHPEKRGLLYDDLENLLDSIPARKKLLMIDACHSGEVDKDELKVDTSLLADNNVKMIPGNKGGQTLVNKNSIGLQNSFELMQELFANVSKGTGAVVISAAGGKEYALESGKWNNGVFTYCVRQALEEKAADVNKDNEISIAELKDYVSKEVERLTQGRQKPTARKENLEVDWRVK